MRTALPGKPQAKLQAVTTAEWQGERLVVRILALQISRVMTYAEIVKAYISGNAVVILDGQFNLLQTTYLEQCHALNAISIDSHSGKIATCDAEEAFVYKPYGRDEGALKVLNDFISSKRSSDLPDLVVAADVYTPVRAHL